LAERVGYSAETIRKIETEERRPSAQLVDQLAALFEIPEDQRKDFLRFARGDWQAAPSGNVESSPWSVARSREGDDPLKPKIHLATFLFTDIEDSSKLWEHEPEKMKVALQRHHEILQEAIVSNGGEVFQIIGDAFCAAFPTVLSAVSSAVISQQELHREQWDLPFPIRVRMGIHTGEAERKLNGDYASGPTLNRVARILAAAHGGQVLLSLATKDLIKDSLPADTELRDMGEHYLKNLMYPEHLFQLTIAGLRSDFPSLNTLTQRHNLPAQLTTFIGREGEIAEIKKALESHRLVTLTGPGGIGKTRLSVQVATQVLETFPDGLWFVELAPLTDPDLIVQTIHTTLGLAEQPGKNILQMLIDYLSQKKTLLILDNCEHLVEACAQLTHTLLGQSPSLKILTSSREALGVQGEVAWPVPSLSLPDPKKIPELDQLTQYEAVHLFLDRASLANPHFRMTEGNAPAIAQICYRLDGIPLAIELAAARIKGLGPEQIASRLDDRFHLLTSGARTVLPRHQTLHALIDWSHDLLSEAERALLRRLSVFAGGWTLEAAESVCAGDGLELDQILDVLLHLVDKSLVVAKTQGTEPRYPAGGSLRYHMLETIRQYAQEKLADSGESSLLRDRHLEYFRSLGEQARPHFRDAEQIMWLDRFETELDNVRAALTWALDGGSVESGLRLASDLGVDTGAFWVNRDHIKEGHELLEQLLLKSQATVPVETLAAGYLSVAAVEFWLGDMADAHDHVEQSESLWSQLGPSYKTKAAEARVTKIYIDWNFAQDPSEVCRQFQENLPIFQETGDRWLMAYTLFGIANGLRQSGDLPGARQTMEQSQALFQECGDGLHVNQANIPLALTAIKEGRYTEARKLCEEMLAYFRQMRFSLRHAPLWILGALSIMESNYAAAKAWYTECLLFDQEIGIIDEFPEILIGFASIANSERRFERAAQLIGTAEAAVEARQDPLESFHQTELQRLTKLLREELGEAEHETLAAEGRLMAKEQVIALTLENDTA
jgi:predicted ATPase/class 3 adenylate cyclase/DNA-binding XRE family transcriptional regulator